MSTSSALGPMFSDVPISFDDARAIAGALYDIAESDGVHPAEIEMIRGLLESLDADLGHVEPTQLEKMTPDKLAHRLSDPNLRMIAVQCAVLLAWADGKLTPKERERVIEYATALGVTGKSYEQVESAITQWVKTGDMKTVLG